MKAYRITITICLAAALICGIAFFVKQRINLSHDERSNTECKTEQRIFDYYDALTDSEESNLLDKLEELENTIGADIVIVTLDNNTDFSFIDGAASDINLDIQYLTEMFADYYMFGWEAWEEVSGQAYKYESGTCVVIAANWDTGDLWMATSGRARERINWASDIVQAGGEYLRTDPEKGFEVMLDEIYSAMKGSSSMELARISALMSMFGVFIALLAAIVFFIINYSKKPAKRTTNASTYVRGGSAKVLDSRDLFMHKNVTSVRINTDGGGPGGGSHGGGGGHHSGGGHYGGGGGHF